MINGLGEIAGKLNKLTSTMRKEVKAANKDAADGVATVARARAPKRTGRMANTIKPFGTLRGGGVQVGGARVPYANPLHWGTGPRKGRRGPHNISPNPFLYDALDNRRDAVIKRYEDATGNAIDEAGL